MNADIKQQWIKDLRSGEYVQGQEHLRNSDGTMCCMGVLCDQHRKAGLGKWLGRSYYADDYSYSDIVLPGLVVDWAGLDTVNPRCQGIGLDSWNDSQKKSFNEIADLIEKYL